MIESIVNKIIIGGIQNFAKTYESTNDTTQIRIYYDENRQVAYDACVNWQPKERVSFKQILNKKLDLLGYEQLSTPIFEKALVRFSDQFDIPESDISVFIFYLKNQIGLCIFNKSDSVHTASLAQTLPSLLV